MAVNRHIFRFLVLAALPVLGACVPKLGPPPQPVSAGALASAASLPDQGGQWPGDGWWSAYGDPQLDRLIAEGLAGSPDVAAAAARIARAEGVARQAGAALGPEIGGNASAGTAKQSYNNGIPKAFLPKGWKSTGNLNLQLAWDLDLFGRNRATRRAALSEAEAARIDAAEARLALAAAIASAYADLARFRAERDVAADALRIQGESARLVAQRVSGGLDTEAERAQANALVPTSRADLAALDESIDLTRHRIAALVGAGPDRALTIARPPAAALRALPLPPQAGIALVGRRPDIAAARARAEAAAERVKAAHAAFYPNLNLSALVGFQALGISQLVDAGSTYGSAGPALSLPLFDAGRRRADYRVARADYDAAVADYDGTLVDALREVADAVASRTSLAAQLADARASLAESETAFRIARLRYQGGLSTYLSVLSAEQTLLAARRRVADATARGFALDVALVRALGGGFASR